MEQIHDQIFAQENVSLGIKRSAWDLFRHELTRTDPDTGRAYTARKAMRNVMKWIAGQMAREKTTNLTPTERSIVKLLVEGLTLKEISLEMKISFTVVKRHMRHVRRKTGLVSTYQVVALAVERGWVRAPRIDNHE